MNKTKIDWCDMSWNPVTGCLHDCEYCYARKIANRFACKSNLTYVDGVNPSHLSKIPYPFGFLPTLHPYRLDEPSRKKKGISIFVCSMADLFGEWVPDEWIKKVFDACKRAPQHKYIFLTKNPGRYINLLSDLRDNRKNMWFGASVTDDKSFEEIGYELFESTGGLEEFRANRFLSIEPLVGEIKEISLVNIQYLDWIIVGAETGNRKDKVIPKKKWIMNIMEKCDTFGVPLFMKESLRELMGDDFIQEYPR